jgi:hypothetical protein
LLLLLHHSFIAAQQAVFHEILKCNLQSNEFVVLCDFTENYSFTLQDEAQSFHRKNAEATIHPFVTYFNKSDTIYTEHENLVMLSDCLNRDSVLVQTFQQYLMKFIENTFEQPQKKTVHFFAGSAA